jgi:hypothetical protein
VLRVSASNFYPIGSRPPAPMYPFRTIWSTSQLELPIIYSDHFKSTWNSIHQSRIHFSPASTTRLIAHKFISCPIFIFLSSHCCSQALAKKASRKTRSPRQIGSYPSGLVRCLQTAWTAKNIIKFVHLAMFTSSNYFSCCATWKKFNDFVPEKIISRWFKDL